MRKRVLLLCVLCVFFLSTQKSVAQAEANTLGPYLEIAGTFFGPVNSPVVNDSLFFPSFGDYQEVGPGGGFHLALGFDTRWIGFGTKGRFEFFDADPVSPAADPNHEGMVFSWDMLEVKIYPFDWFNADLGGIRPYGILGGGINFNTLSFFGGHWNAGGGIQYLFAENFYMAFEVTHRPFFWDDDNSGSDEVHTISIAAITGLRF